MPKISPLVLAPPLIFAALAVTFFIGLGRDDPNAIPSNMIGRAAPVLSAEPLGDYPSFDSSVFQDGEIKLVNFWASWCAPCRAEHPNLIEISKVIPIYGVNQKDRPDDASKFLADLGNPFMAMTTDREGRQSLNWGVYGLPETFLLDRDGKILLRFVGPLTQRRMKSELYPAIEAAR